MNSGSILQNISSIIKDNILSVLKDLRNIIKNRVCFITNYLKILLNEIY